VIITVSNHKGGVGKTALAAHLAFRAAEQLRVLAIDLDVQGNLSTTLLDRNARRSATAEQLFGDEQPEPMRTGQVIDAGEDVTVIQVLEETVGLSPSRAVVRMTGAAVMATVGRELLGRVLNGLGEPLDDLPAPVGDAVVPVAGAPMNPAMRTPPADFIETGVSAIDGLNTLVRGQKLPIFAGIRASVSFGSATFPRRPSALRVWKASTADTQKMSASGRLRVSRR